MNVINLDPDFNPFASTNPVEIKVFDFPSGCEPHIKISTIDDKGEYRLKDQCTWEEEATGELQVIFEDGKFFNETTLTEIRERINSHLTKKYEQEPITV